MADMAAYWVSHDALATQAERNALHETWLLAHGAYWRPAYDPRNHSGKPELAGGVEPVRV